MPSVLDDLKDDHKQLLEILNEIKRLGIANRTGREKLISAKELLLSHVRREDQDFYPALHRAAEQNESLNKTLKYFSDNMEQVSRKAMDLFDKYSGGASADDFSGEITLLYMTLKDRIRTEEDILFRRYVEVIESRVDTSQKR